MTTKYQTAYATEYARMRALGHSEMFARVAAGRVAVKLLFV